MIFLFDKFKKLKGTVRNRHTISLLYERERNGLYTVSAEIPLKITDKKTVYNYHKKVKDSDFLGHYDREGRFQLHKIASVDIEDSSIFIKGVHLFFDEAKAGAIIQERRFRDSEIVDGARVAFDTIGWSVVDVDVSDRADYIFYNVSPLEARAILVETFDYEFDYWLDFDGKNIRNKQISIKREMGKDSNKRYNYGHNVLNIKVEQDYSEIYTAVIGRGKGEDLGDDAYGRRIEFTDVEWKTPSKPMNKPKGSRVLHDENATQLFGYHEDGKVSPRTKVEIFEDIEDPAKLLRASYNWLKENSVPKAVFSLKVPDGDGLDLGDKVHVIYRDIDLVKHTRVTKVVDDLVSGNRDVEFGDTAYFKTDRRLSGVKSELKRVGGSMSSRISRLKAEFDRRFDNEVKQWKDDFEQALIDAEAAVEAMRVTMTEEFEAAQKAFEVEFNQSVADAKKHADAVADAKASQVQGNLDSFAGRHEQLVGELQGNIVNINGEIADARADVSGILGRLTGVDGSISGIKGSLTEIEGTLTNTKTQLESQITDARTELEKSISDARAEIEGLEVGGRNLIVNSDDLKPSSSNANVTVSKVSDGSFSNVFKSETEVAGASSYFTTIYGQVSENPKIGQKATLSLLIRGVVFEGRDNTLNIYYNSGTKNQDMIGISEEYQWLSVTFDVHSEVPRFHFYPQNFSELYIARAKLEIGNIATDWTPAPEDTEQKITSINQTITNLEGELSSKVEQTEVDALKGTVERQGTLLTQTAEEVSSKAEKSVVDTLTGRVANTESSVTQNAEEIATKVSSTEFDALTDIVSDSTTAISQNTQNISLKANQSELNQVANRVASAESELSVQAGEIELRATKSELDDVEGRVTATEASLKVADNQISSVVGRVTEAETEISSVVQDVSSITSTVTSLEDDVATQGSQITQNKDIIESKVWLDDVANINPNLIPFTDVSAKESKPHWNNWGSAATNTWVDNLGYMNVDTTDTNSSIRIQSEEFELVEGQEYTLSFLARTSASWNTDGMFAYTFVLWPGQSSNQILSSANHTIENLGGRLSGLRRYTHTFTARHTGKAKIMLGTYKFRPEEYARFSFKEPKLEKGSERTPFLNAFSNIEQTANTIKLDVLGELEGGYVTKSEFDVTIEGIESRVSKIDGGGVLKQSDISVTSDSVIIGSQEISSTKLASIIAVSPSAVDIITKKLNLTGNLNVKGQIESISTSAVKADFANIFAGTADIQFIVAKHLASNSIQTRHLYVTNAMAEKIIANTVMAREVKALSLDAVEANIGSIRSKILTSNVIKSSHIAGGTALIDKIFSSKAMFERMMAKSAFVSTLNTITIDTDQITIRRPDGGRLINNGMLQASFDVQIRPNHASSAVDFTGINYATSSSYWQTFEHFYTDHKGSKLLISWAVDFYGPSASEYIEVRVRGFGGNNPIGTSNKRIFSNGSTAYLNQTVSLGVPDYKTIQAYLEFRRSPTGSSAKNTVRARVLRVSLID